MDSAADLSLTVDLATPFTFINVDVAVNNITTMQRHANDIGAALWPHYKSHKLPWLLEQQVTAGATGATVATLHQLRSVQSAQPLPILLAGMPQFDRAVHQRLRAAAEDAQVLFTADSADAIEALALAIGSRAGTELLIEVDVGTGRTGALRPELARVADSAASHEFVVRGVCSYPGGAYVPGAAQAAAALEADSLQHAAQLVREQGHPCDILSGGSTPTASHYPRSAITMVRPGTYVFGDRQQLLLGSATTSSIGLVVVATVLARRADRIVTDAGGRSLGRDHRSWLAGYGELENAPMSIVTSLFDHHSVIELKDCDARPGDRVAIIPNNSNSVIALHRSVVLYQGGHYQVAQLSP